jgi:hypothetical protein
MNEVGQNPRSLRQVTAFQHYGNYLRVLTKSLRRAAKAVVTSAA